MTHAHEASEIELESPAGGMPGTILVSRPKGASTPAAPVRPYVDLDGAQGREVFFRPHRYHRGDLGPVRPIVRVVTDAGVAHECALHDVSAVVLCRTLFAGLNPGGRLYIGNTHPKNPSRWFMELHLEWFLVYRTPLEMLEFARLAAPHATIDALEDSTGISPFVSLTHDPSRPSASASSPPDPTPIQG
ncbi:MAG: hypothetical protein JOZ69_00045 [Myxococcales bacterium]|nr:hypothetical protein [Myxococcales bacterium]